MQKDYEFSRVSMGGSLEAAGLPNDTRRYTAPILKTRLDFQQNDEGGSLDVRSGNMDGREWTLPPSISSEKRNPIMNMK